MWLLSVSATATVVPCSGNKDRHTAVTRTNAERTHTTCSVSVSLIGVEGIL